MDGIPVMEVGILMAEMMVTGIGMKGMGLGIVVILMWL